MSENTRHANGGGELHFHAVCHDCGTLKDELYDNSRCECGGIFHVDSSRCLGCGKRYPFDQVGLKCTCGGEIVPKMVSCPACKMNMKIDHLGENCPKCNVQLIMEG